MNQRAPKVFAPAVSYLREENRSLESKSSRVATTRFALMTHDGKHFSEAKGSFWSFRMYVHKALSDGMRTIEHTELSLIDTGGMS